MPRPRPSVRAPITAAALIASIVAVCITSPAHAQVGNRNFIEPLVEQDANPSNSFDFSPQWLAVKHGTIVSLVFSLEKQITDNSSVYLGSAWNDPSCDKHAVCDQIGAIRRGRGRHRHRLGTQVFTGFEDLEAMLKYAFLKSDVHELRMAIGLDTFLPIGNPTAGGGTYTAIGPIFMLAKGMGDIPDRAYLRYMRPFALQADFEYLFNTGGPAASEPIGDWVVSYDLSYLDRYVNDFHLCAPFDHLVPFAEFTYDQIVKARYTTGQADLRVMPGFAYMRDAYQISVATSLALNQATVHNNHAGVELLLSLVLDKIWPVMGAQVD